MSLFRSNLIMLIRERVAKLRGEYDPFYKAKWLRIKKQQHDANQPYEMELDGYWRPSIMSLDETMKYIIENKSSVCRFGDGEMELIAGRGMLFENANNKMKEQLIGILSNPLDNCLCCIPNVYGSLTRYEDRDIGFWRDFALWSRPLLQQYLHDDYQNRKFHTLQHVLGDPYISRSYLNIKDKTIAPRIFALWKELFKRKKILIVEGRFSRVGIGNDLLEGAESIRRIWCPPKAAFSRYDEIISIIKKEVKENELIILALGATATILAYNLAKEGYWAIDTGHLDVEYMWMKMGATEKVAIQGRYVSEVTGGQEQIEREDEEIRYNVIAKIGC